MKKTYLEPKMEVVRLKMESLMTSASIGEEEIGSDWTSGEAGSRQGRGFGDE